MGKKMRAAVEKLEPRAYALREAVDAVKRSAYTKFDESVDLALRLARPRCRMAQGRKFAYWFLPRERRSRRLGKPVLIMSVRMT